MRFYDNTGSSDNFIRLLQIMRTKLSFAQRLQKQSLSIERIHKVSPAKSEKLKEVKKHAEKNQYTTFKQQHNELKNILKLFEGHHKDELDPSPEMVPTTPIRNRRIALRTANKNEPLVLKIKAPEAVKQKNHELEWPISLKDTFKSNASVMLPKTTSLIGQDRGRLTPRSRAPQIKKGIPNNGNTCYINALVQCLFHLPHFNDYFVQKKYERENNGRKKDVVELYRALYVDVMQNRDQIEISTLPLKKSVSKICMLFIDWEQEDAHQFMKELINSVHEDINRIRVRPKYRDMMRELEGEDLETMAAAFWDYEKQRDDSYVYDCLAGQLYNSIKCINCQHISEGFENFLDLSLPMVPHASSLEKLLAYFFQPQKLSDFYLCSQCGKSSKKSTKSLELWRAPKFLIIQLKRSQFSKKNTDPIKIPESLSLKQYMTLSNDRSARYCQYSLCGIIMHQGVIEGGHYWCTVKESGKWFQIDDEKVTDLNSQNFKAQLSQKGSSNAYILFYSSLYC